MSLQVQLLQDAPQEVDHAPLLEFAQWMREHGDTGFYVAFDNSDTHTSILDLGHIIQGIEEWQDPDFGGAEAGIPAPPDIREWCQKEIDAARCLAWISW